MLKTQEEMIVKFIKKIMAIAISLVMALTLCVPALAEGNGADGDTTGSTTTVNTYKITAPAADGKYKDHQYEIYQIFTATITKEDGKDILTDEKWGANAKNGNDAVTVGDSVPEAVLNELKGLNSESDTEKLKVITKYVNLNSTPVATLSNGSSYDAVPGYYLIKDKDNTVSGNDSYTLYVVKVVDGDLTIAPKAEVPSFEKKIKDTNDTTGVTSGWQDSADYDIGDQVPFQLKGTVASDYDNYKTYYFAFHDKEEDGLTFNADSVKVYVDGNLIENTADKTYYTVNTSCTDGCTFEVVFNNLKDIASVKAGSEITVEYTSELNKKANIGSEGNVNQGKLEFSNNPNEEQNGTDKPGTGETPWDNVIVFTYQVIVNKVDENKKPLTGAEFTLIKKVAQTDAEGNIVKDAEGNTVYTEEVIDVIKSTDGTTFTFKGLDDGDYILRETKTPTGYNTIDDIEFTVNADHTIDWDGLNRTGVLTGLSGNVTTGNITFTANTDKGSLSTDVVNKKGVELPSTGGIGTTIFYVIGGLMMAAAAVLFVTKKRLESNK